MDRTWILGYLGRLMQNSTYPQKAPLLVTAAVIQDGNEILIAQRQMNHAIEGGKWEFPGGKVEFGENPEACIEREIKEELNLEVEAEKLLGISSHVYEEAPGPLHVVLLFYQCRLKGARSSVKHLAVEDTRWITNNQIGHYDFAAADVPFLEEAFRIVRDAKIG